MSTPKKPGTDLAALKARLAKKSKAKSAGAPVAPPGGLVPPPGEVSAPPPDVPAPGEVLPAPGQVLPAPGEVLPAPGQVAPGAVPAPGESLPPPAEIPAPGEFVPASAPDHASVATAPVGAGMGGIGEPAPALQPPPADPDDPFGGGMGGAFDPSEGLIDSGAEIQARSNKGLLLFGAFGAALIGGITGWLLHTIVQKREAQAVGQAKGAEMVAEVDKVIDTRAGVSLAMDDLEKTIREDPAKGAEKIEKLIADNFTKHPKLDALFGWPLASVHTNGIKRTFELYDEANRLKTDLGYLANFVRTNADTLKESSGPAVFGLAFSKDGNAKLVSVKPLCAAPAPEGEKPAEGAAPKPKTCAVQDFSKAIAFLAFDNFSPEAKGTVMPKGLGPGQATFLLPEGAVYAYAIGMEPKRNAAIQRNFLVGRLKDRLEKMAKVEGKASRALKNYASDPTIDGSNPQPDPEDE